MDALDELSSLVAGGSRVIIIADRDVDLSSKAGSATLFLLSIASGSSAAGGRGGGFGERRVVAAACFSSADGAWRKTFETHSESEAGGFEVPYYVSRIPLTLADGSQTMGYGVVEPELVRQMARRAGAASSP